MICDELRTEENICIHIIFCHLFDCLLGSLSYSRRNDAKDEFLRISSGRVVHTRIEPYVTGLKAIEFVFFYLHKFSSFSIIEYWFLPKIQICIVSIVTIPPEQIFCKKFHRSCCFCTFFSYRFIFKMAQLNARKWFLRK